MCGLLIRNVYSPSGSDHHNMDITENEHHLLEILQTHVKIINTWIGWLMVKYATLFISQLNDISLANQCSSAIH